MQIHKFYEKSLMCVDRIMCRSVDRSGVDDVAVEDHNNLGSECKEDRGRSVPCTEGRVDGSLFCDSNG